MANVDEEPTQAVVAPSELPVAWDIAALAVIDVHKRRVAALEQLIADVWRGGEALWERCDRAERALEVERLRVTYLQAYSHLVSEQTYGGRREIELAEESLQRAWEALRAKGAEL